MITMCVGLIISLILGVVLLYKCAQKRRVAQDIKNQMQLKKQMYATNLGVSFF